MTPTVQEAEYLLEEAGKCNPGAWVSHSRTAAHCAYKIAQRCNNLNAEKAYVLGLLHDIGRKFGVSHIRHIFDGYVYMLSLGYDEVARVCLTHSFNNRRIDDYVGRIDITQEELEFLQNNLEKITFDDYDKLIQLCDAIAGADGVLNIEERMNDVERRYGSYPQAKRQQNLALKKYFENVLGEDIYTVVEKNTYRPY